MIWQLGAAVLSSFTARRKFPSSRFTKGSSRIRMGDCLRTWFLSGRASGKVGQLPRAFGKITHFPCRSVRRQLRSEIGGYYRVAERSVGGLRNETQKVFSKLWRVSGGELFFGLGKQSHSRLGGIVFLRRASSLSVALSSIFSVSATSPVSLARNSASVFSCARSACRAESSAASFSRSASVCP